MSETDLVAEIRERHIELDGWCHFCNKAWPCDAIRAVEEIERLQKNYDLAASVVAELTNQETEEDKGRLCTEIKRLREALNKAHRALLGGSYKSQESQMAKAENILRVALNETDSATIDESLSDA